VEIRPVETVGTVTSTTFAYFRLLRILRRLHPHLSSSLLAERLEHARDIGFLRGLCDERNDRDCGDQVKLPEGPAPRPAAGDLKPLDLHWPTADSGDRQLVRPVVIVQPMPIAIGVLFDMLI